MRTHFFVTVASIAIGGLLSASIGWTHEGHDHDAEMRRAQHVQVHEHAEHDATTDGTRGNYGRSLRAYLVPDVTLTNADARRVRLLDVVAADGAILIDLVSTRCATPCAEMSKAFSMLPKRLGKQAGNVRMISLFIDPEHDTPAALKGYAKQYGALPNWHLLTGSAQEIEGVRRAFDDERGDKASIEPLALLRAAPGMPWLRIEGSATADELAREYQALMKK
jgi:protein SCO1